MVSDGKIGILHFSAGGEIIRSQRNTGLEPKGQLQRKQRKIITTLTKITFFLSSFAGVRSLGDQGFWYRP